MAIAQVGSTTGAYNSSTYSPVVPIPTGVESGDLLIATFILDYPRGIDSATGWVQVGTNEVEGPPSFDCQGTVLRRVADGTEGSSWTFTNLFDGTAAILGNITAYRGVDTSSPIHTYDQDQELGVSGTISAPSITTTVNGCMIFYFLACDPSASDYASDPDDDPAATELYDGNEETVTTTYTHIQHYLQPASGSIALDARNCESDSWIKFQIALTPAITYTLEQEGFRFRNDDEDEDSATWIDVQDADISKAKNTNFRVRILIDATNDPSALQYQLEYKKSTASGWAKVTT